MCFVHSQYKGGGLRPPPQRGGRPKAARPFVVSFALAVNKAHVLDLNPANVLRLNKADVLALNKAYVLRLNNTCPVFRANTKVASFGRHHKGVGGLRPPAPFWFPLYWL